MWFFWDARPAKGSGCFRVTVIPGGINSVRHVVSDHAVLRAFFIIFRQTAKNDFADCLNCGAPIIQQFGEVLVRSSGFALYQVNSVVD